MPEENYAEKVKDQARDFINERLEEDDFDAMETLSDLSQFFDGDPADLF